MKTNTKAFISYSILSIIWGMTLLASAVSMVMYIVTVFFIKSTDGYGNLIVRLEPVIKTKAAETGSYLLRNIEGNLSILDQSSYYFALHRLIPVLVLTSLSYAIYLLRKILRNVADANYFSELNVKYMKRIALLMAVVPHIIVLLQNIVFNSLPKNIIVDGFKIENTFSWSGSINLLSPTINVSSFTLIPEYLFWALIIWIFADVFKAANKIKQENDLTV